MKYRRVNSLEVVLLYVKEDKSACAPKLKMASQPIPQRKKLPNQRYSHIRLPAAKKFTFVKDWSSPVAIANGQPALSGTDDITDDSESDISQLFPSPIRRHASQPAPARQTVSILEEEEADDEESLPEHVHPKLPASFNSTVDSTTNRASSNIREGRENSGSSQTSSMTSRSFRGFPQNRRLPPALVLQHRQTNARPFTFVKDWSSPVVPAAGRSSPSLTDVTDSSDIDVSVSFPSPIPRYASRHAPALQTVTIPEEEERDEDSQPEVEASNKGIAEQSKDADWENSSSPTKSENESQDFLNESPGLVKKGRKSLNLSKVSKNTNFQTNEDQTRRQSNIPERRMSTGHKTIETDEDVNLSRQTEQQGNGSFGGFPEARRRSDLRKSGRKTSTDISSAAAQTCQCRGKSDGNDDASGNDKTSSKRQSVSKKSIDITNSQGENLEHRKSQRGKKSIESENPSDSESCGDSSEDWQRQNRSNQHVESPAGPGYSDSEAPEPQIKGNQSAKGDNLAESDGEVSEAGDDMDESDVQIPEVAGQESDDSEMESLQTNSNIQHLRRSARSPGGQNARSSKNVPTTPKSKRKSSQKSTVEIPGDSDSEAPEPQIRGNQSARGDLESLQTNNNRQQLRRSARSPGGRNARSSKNVPTTPKSRRKSSQKSTVEIPSDSDSEAPEPQIRGNQSARGDLESLQTNNNRQQLKRSARSLGGQNTRSSKNVPTTPKSRRKSSQKSTVEIPSDSDSEAPEPQIRGNQSARGDLESLQTNNNRQQLKRSARSLGGQNAKSSKNVPTTPKSRRKSSQKSTVEIPGDSDSDAAEPQIRGNQSARGDLESLQTNNNRQQLKRNARSLGGQNARSSKNVPTTPKSWRKSSQKSTVEIPGDSDSDAAEPQIRGNQSARGDLESLQTNNNRQQLKRSARSLGGQNARSSKNVPITPKSWRKSSQKSTVEILGDSDSEAPEPQIRGNQSARGDNLTESDSEVPESGDDMDESDVQIPDVAGQESLQTDSSRQQLRSSRSPGGQNARSSKNVPTTPKSRRKSSQKSTVEIPGDSDSEAPEPQIRGNQSARGDMTESDGEVSEAGDDMDESAVQIPEVADQESDDSEMESLQTNNNRQQLRRSARSPGGRNARSSKNVPTTPKSRRKSSQKSTVEIPGDSDSEAPEPQIRGNQSARGDTESLQTNNNRQQLRRSSRSPGGRNARSSKNMPTTPKSRRKSSHRSTEEIPGDSDSEAPEPQIRGNQSARGDLESLQTNNNRQQLRRSSRSPGGRNTRSSKNMPTTPKSRRKSSQRSTVEIPGDSDSEAPELQIRGNQSAKGDMTESDGEVSEAGDDMDESDVQIPEVAGQESDDSEMESLQTNNNRQQLRRSARSPGGQNARSSKNVPTTPKSRGKSSQKSSRDDIDESDVQIPGEAVQESDEGEKESNQTNRDRQHIGSENTRKRNIVTATPQSVKQLSKKRKLQNSDGKKNMSNAKDISGSLNKDVTQSRNQARGQSTLDMYMKELSSSKSAQIRRNLSVSTRDLGSSGQVDETPRLSRPSANLQRRLAVTSFSEEREQGVSNSSQSRLQRPTPARGMDTTVNLNDSLSLSIHDGTPEVKKIGRAKKGKQNQINSQKSTAVHVREKTKGKAKESGVNRASKETSLNMLEEESDENHNGKRRKKRTAAQCIDLDVVLNVMEKVAGDFRDTLTDTVCRKAVRVFFKSIQSEITDTIDSFEEVRDLQTRIKKRTQNIKRLQKELTEAKREANEYEVDLYKLKSQFKSRSSQIDMTRSLSEARSALSTFRSQTKK